MKKFFQEFKAFISRGNVMDLAVGVIIGSAFTGVVTALTDSIIKPLLNCIGGAEIQGKIHLLGDNYLDYGAFLSAVVNFLIRHRRRLPPRSAPTARARLTLLPPAVPTAPRCWRTKRQSNDSEN